MNSSCRKDAYEKFASTVEREGFDYALQNYNPELFRVDEKFAELFSAYSKALLLIREYVEDQWGELEIDLTYIDTEY